MPQRDEFAALLNALKAASPSITDEQRRGLLRQATRKYGLSVEEASQILKDSGLVVGELINYFEVLGFSLDEFDGSSESAIASKVDVAYDKLYKASLSAGARRRPDGRPEDQWRQDLIHARDTLKDASKRKEHLAALRQEKELTEAPVSGVSRLFFKFPNGDEAMSITQLATLMEKNATDATKALYHDDIERGLGGAGEMLLADAARAVVSQYPREQEVGLRAIVQILRGKMQFDRGGEASTPPQIARLIDQNWEQGKTYLYNGFIALWLKYARQEGLADTAKKITSLYRDDKDIGLEMFAQKLDPQIGQPKLKTSHARLNFGKVDTETRKAVRLEIMNAGRGFLYGKVQLANGMAGVEISTNTIHGNTLVTVDLDTQTLTVKRTHKTDIVITTNGGILTVPIFCYVDYPIEKSIKRIAISGSSVAAITLFARLVLLLFGRSTWLATDLTSNKLVSLRDMWGRGSEWFRWPWFKWSIYVPDGAGYDLIAAFAALCTGAFIYWFYFLRRR